MLAFPQPASGEAEVLGGSPVVSLHDSAADVCVRIYVDFSNLNYPYSYFIPTEPSSFDFKLQTVLGILRLAHKYDVPYLVRRALEFLSYGKGAWRWALDEWSVDWYRAINGGRNGLIHKPRGEPACVRYMLTIAAATEVGALWLLPVLYYQASKYPEDRLRLALAHGIDINVVQRCLSAHGHRSRGTTAVNAFLSIPSNTGCTSPEHCDKVRFQRLGNYFEHVRRKVDLAPLDDWSNEEWEVLACELCGHCLKKPRRAIGRLWPNSGTNFRASTVYLLAGVEGDERFSDGRSRLACQDRPFGSFFLYATLAPP
ncbi:hypothetical protein B0H13DRAFT_2420194 [Mycena leptocephala]|nr:hypothetical protein B0H13DRAFT_2420194 [Mycena leptocephala]